MPIRVQHWGYNSAFLPFLGIGGGGGGIIRFGRFISLNDLKNLGVYSGFNENILKKFKTRIKKH